MCITSNRLELIICLFYTSWKEQGETRAELEMAKDSAALWDFHMDTGS